MNLSTSVLSAPTPKRPRTSAVMPLDLTCTSTLTERAFVANEMVAPATMVDKALAALDFGLGLGTLQHAAPDTEDISESIEQELEAVLNGGQNERSRAAVELGARNVHPSERSQPFLGHEVPDNASCVSGSGTLGHGTIVKAEDSSDAVDVLRELESLESRVNTTVMSPPLVKPLVKQKRRR